MKSRAGPSSLTPGLSKDRFADQVSDPPEDVRSSVTATRRRGLGIMSDAIRLAALRGREQPSIVPWIAERPTEQLATLRTLTVEGMDKRGCRAATRTDILRSNSGDGPKGAR